MECSVETFGCKSASTRGFTSEARNLLILLPSLSLSGPAKVEKCGVEFRTSPQKEEDHSLYSFFSNVEKWIKWRNSSKQTEGKTHAHI